MAPELREQVRAMVLQFLEGKRSEGNKFDVKRKWYSLREDYGRNEFLKDITAMVNSYGGEDAFIVFGIDESNKEVFETKLSDCGYPDLADIKNIVGSNIDGPIRLDLDNFEINGKHLSVLHLLPSTSKPHCLLKYINPKGQSFNNEIFIRSGSSNAVATRSDIDRMYVERKNIIVERRLELCINKVDLIVRKNDNGFFIDHPITLENTGNRVAAIARIEIELLFGDKHENKFQNVYFYTQEFSFQNLILHSGDVFNQRVIFKTPFNDEAYYHRVIKSNLGVNARIREPRIVLANEEQIFPNLIVHATAGDFPINAYDLS